jgi:hypothetical protein
VDSIVNFWISETRNNPNRKDVVKKFISRKVWEQHATHFLKESQVHFIPLTIEFIFDFHAKVCNFHLHES